MEKERRTKALLLSTLVVVVATLSIAFASLSRTLSINGIGKMDTASWSVYFNDLKGPNITRGAKQISAPSISVDKGIVQDINVKLSNPKDEISYTVDIVNDGTIDAEITMIKDIELTDAQKKVFEFKVTYTDTGEILKDGDLLPAGKTKNITINIKFKDDITEFDLPTESQTINLSYQITYIQYDGKEIVGPNGGGVTPSKLKPESTMDDYFLRSYISDSSVESITFLSEYKAIENAKKTWDASEARDNSVIGSYTDIDSNGLYEVYIGGTNGVYAPSDSSDLFYKFTNLKEINFNGNFDTSQTVDMQAMFDTCSSLTSLDLSSFNTSNVIDMNSMFADCNSLTNLDLSYFNTSNVTSMNTMFWGCSALTSLDLSSFNTSNVTDMFNMFSNCTSLTNLDLSLFDTRNVTSMWRMFEYCSSLTSLDLSSFNTSNVTDMESMFDGCSSLEILNLDNFDFRNVDSSSYFVESCSKLTTISLNFAYIPKSINVFKNLFSGASSSLEYVSMKNSKISSELTSFNELFLDLSALKEVNIQGVNTSSITDMRSMFSGCTSLASLDLSSFNTSNVTNMFSMFQGCKSLISLDLSTFNTSNVTNMQKMFSSCSSLTNLDVSSFNTSNVTNMSGMFYNCSLLASLDLSAFDTSNVTSVGSNYSSSFSSFGMFANCTSLVEIKFNSAVFDNISEYYFLFKNVPNNFTIYVKDEAAKNFILGLRSDANVIIEPLTS